MKHSSDQEGKVIAPEALPSKCAEIRKTHGVLKIIAEMFPEVTISKINPYHTIPQN